MKTSHPINDDNYFRTIVGAKQQEENNNDDLTDEEYDAIAEEAYDNLVHSLIEAGGEIRELRELLTRAYEQLLLLGYDSGFTNEQIYSITTDISKYFEGIKE